MTTQEAPPGNREVDERVREVGLVSRLLIRPELAAVIALVVVWVFFAIVAYDNNFVSWSTTAAILNRATPLGILAVAVALLMISGEFDLSVGSLVGFAGMAIMVLVTPTGQGGYEWGLWPAVLAALVITLAAGFLNGVLVVWTRLPSFIITLAALFIFRGLTIAVPRALTNRTELSGFDTLAGADFLNSILGRRVTLFNANFDIAILWWIGITILATWVLLRTRVGNWIFGVGGDNTASRNVGVPVRRLKIALFMTTAFAAFLVALTQVSQFGNADSLRGQFMEFRAIIAAVVGGVLLTGGYGSVVGASVGALIFAMVQQGIIITGVDGDWFQVFMGAILILAVIFNNFVRQQAQKR